MPEFEHDIISALYALRGMIETHLENVRERRFVKPGAEFADAEQVLHKAYASTDYALAIARKLKDIYACKNTSLRPTPPGSVLEAWREVKTILAGDGDDDGIEILERIPADFPLISCEKTALREIFYHLAKNACQAMRGAGKLIIRAQMAYSLTDELQAVIAISDTGPGIPEEQMTHLFEPFYSTKEPEEGNGLGLCLVRVLAARHRGKVQVSSFGGCGTTFTLYFPVRSASASAMTA